MKYLSMLLVFLLLLSGSAFAQQEDGGIRTLFKKSDKDKKIHVGWYIGPEGAWTRFKQKDVFLGGISFGVTLDHFFSVGLAGSGILNPGNLWYDDVWEKNGAYLAGGYGGVRMEFTLFPKYPVHLSFPLLIGGGGLTYLHRYYYDWNYYYDVTSLDWDAFFVVEPGIRVELNVVKFMRIYAGAAYRYTPDLDLINTPADLINNFNAVFGLKFGKF